GLQEFPELYAYIHEGEPKPIVDGIANQTITVPQQDLNLFSRHALVLGDDGGHKQNIMGNISEKGYNTGESIDSVEQIISIKGNIHNAIAGVYYTNYEPLKRATSDVNDDGKINIVDDWHVNSIIGGIKSMSFVQDVLQKQTEAIGDG
ncbi:MAG: hypothetical protein EZS28_044479, partial [Streblomastix strix]